MFRYKQDLDPSGALQCGLIAEEVAEVLPDHGSGHTVRWPVGVTSLISRCRVFESLRRHLVTLG